MSWQVAHHRSGALACSGLLCSVYGETWKSSISSAHPQWQHTDAHAAMTAFSLPVGPWWSHHCKDVNTHLPAARLAAIIRAIGSAGDRPSVWNLPTRTTKARTCYCADAFHHRLHVEFSLAHTLRHGDVWLNNRAPDSKCSRGLLVTTVQARRMRPCLSQCCSPPVQSRDRHLSVCITTVCSAHDSERSDAMMGKRCSTTRVLRRNALGRYIKSSKLGYRPEVPHHQLDGQPHAHALIRQIVLGTQRTYA